MGEGPKGEPGSPPKHQQSTDDKDDAKEDNTEEEDAEKDGGTESWESDSEDTGPCTVTKKKRNHALLLVKPKKSCAHVLLVKPKKSCAHVESKSIERGREETTMATEWSVAGRVVAVNSIETLCCHALCMLEHHQMVRLFSNGVRWRQPLLRDSV